MLCTYCDGLTVRRLFELYEQTDNSYRSTSFFCDYYPHQPSFQSLTKSGEDGCELCQAVVNELAANKEKGSKVNERVQMQLDTSIGVSIHVANEGWGGPRTEVLNQLLFRIGKEEEGRSYMSRQFGLVQVEFSLTKPKIALHELYHQAIGLIDLGELNSVENFELSRQWLRTCTSCHRKDTCSTFKPLPLPTRLIYVSPPGSKEIKPKLVEFSSEEGFYIALSHCWGGDVSLKTTVATLESHLQGIPVQTFPKTFYDAMVITRELGYHYLWIDSLCIVQDSIEDWKLESTVMDKVYSNAVLTISASASPSSQSGIFAMIKDVTQYASLKYDHDSPTTEYLKVSSFKSDETRINVLKSLPVATRGWTLQERGLSRRVLHYGARRIYWQCRSAQLSPDITTTEFDVKGPQVGPDRLFIMPQPFTPSFPQEDLRFLSSIEWCQMVEDYSRRTLTFASDKFPAISGIARALSNCNLGKYLAGIWEATWKTDILWMTGFAQVNAAFPERAPSWSWARWDGPIVFQMKAVRLPLLGGLHAAQLLGHDIKLAGSNKWGPVRSGSLHIRGRVKVLPFKELGSLGGVVNLDGIPIRFREFVTSEGYKFRNIELTVLLVGQFRQERAVRMQRVMLILKGLSGTADAQFERIGTISGTRTDPINHDDWDQRDPVIV